MKQLHKFIAIIMILFVAVPVAFSEIYIQSTEETEPVEYESGPNQITKHNFVVIKYGMDGQKEYYDSQGNLITGYVVDEEEEETEEIRIIAVPGNSEVNITPCEEVRFYFNLTNPTDKTVEYDLSVEEFKGEVYLVPSVLLGPGQTKKINYALKPGCGESGLLTPKIRIETSDKEEYALIPLGIFVEGDYGFSLYVEEEYNVCNDVTNEKTIRIANTASLDNEYRITTNKDWVKPAHEYVFFEKGSEKQLKLYLTPEFKTESQSMVEMTITPLYGEEVKTQFNVVTENCYAQDIDVLEKKVCEIDDAFYISLKNTGTKEEDFKLSLNEDKGIMFLEEDTYDLDAGEREEIEVSLSDSISPGKYEFSLVSQIGETGLSKKLDGNLEIVETKNCFDVQVPTSRIRVSHKNETNIILIENKGISGESFDIGFDGPKWAGIDKNRVSIDENNNAVLTLSTNPGSEIKEGNYETKLIMTSVSTNYTYVRDMTITVSDYTLLERLFNNKCSISLLFLSGVGFLLFLKLLYDLSRGAGRRIALLDLISILFIVTLMLFVFMGCFDKFMDKAGVEYVDRVNETQNKCGTYFSEAICNSTFYLQMNEDEDYQLDLDRWFSDPDSDQLTYGVDEVNNLDIEIEGSIVKIVPQKDWFGVKNVMFSAKDGKGGLAESRLFYIHILNKPEFNMKNYLLNNHITLSVSAIIFVVLLIILLITFIILVDLDDKPEEKENREEQKENKEEKEDLPKPEIEDKDEKEEIKIEDEDNKD